MQAKHIKGIISLCAALIAGVALIAASGAGAAKAPRTAQIDVSTKASVVHYLRSIHVNPRGVVIQRGIRNYAGPNCPGKRWSCTSTKHAVVQVARSGGKNAYTCTGSSCAVIQVAAAPTATNTAKCVKTTGLSASCTINQSSTSANNVAIVFQKATKASGLTQSASYSANITQRTTAANAFNKACVLQDVSIDGSTVAKKGTPVSVNLAAHQTVNVTQDSATGDNTVQAATTSTTGACDTTANSPLTQSQSLTSTATGAGPITQNENSVDTGANIALDIKQNQSDGFFGTATGANYAKFQQTNVLKAIANTTAGPVNQAQSSPNGGILAGVNQDSGGLSTAIAIQDETQCEDAHPGTGSAVCDTNTQDPPAYSLTQTQFGPVRKGGGDSIQTGNPNDVFTVDQSSTQDNDLGTNQKNVVQGDCKTSGNCTANQDTTVNGSTASNSGSGSDVNLETKCNGNSCVTFNGPQIAVTNTDVAESGFGGMRGDGTGSIGVSGIPDGSSITAAFLYWNGPTSSADPASNAAVTFGGTSVTGTNIGTASSNCWPFANSQSYRADVTSLVAGNGTYSLSNFLKGDADINGVALLVFYKDTGSSNDRNVTLWNGNDSTFAQSPDPAGWDETIDNVPYNGGTASLDFVVSDGQTADDPQLLVNGLELAPAGPNFSGGTLGGPFDADGSLWDVKSFDVTSLLVAGPPQPLHLATGTNPVGPTVDCTSVVVAAANTPVSGGPVIVAPARQQAASPGRLHASGGVIAGTTASH